LCMVVTWPCLVGLSCDENRAVRSFLFTVHHCIGWRHSLHGNCTPLSTVAPLSPQRLGMADGHPAPSQPVGPTAATPVPEHSRASHHPLYPVAGCMHFWHTPHLRITCTAHCRQHCLHPHGWNVTNCCGRLTMHTTHSRSRALPARAGCCCAAAAAGPGTSCCGGCGAGAAGCTDAAAWAG
jgi:hypothetical protein